MTILGCNLNCQVLNEVYETLEESSSNMNGYSLTVFLCSCYEVFTFKFLFARYALIEESNVG